MWWTALAPLLYPLLILEILRLVAPGTHNALFTEPFSAEQIRAQWQAFALIYLFLFWRITRWGMKSGAGAFGGPLNPRTTWIIAAIILGPVFLHGSFLLMDMLVGGGGMTGEWAWSDDRQMQMFGPDAISLSMIGFTLLLAPVIEEIGYRGIAMGWLIARGLPAAGAVVVTAGVFSLMHFQYTPLGHIPIFLAGVGFGMLRLFSRGMAAPIIAHVSANALALWLSTGG